MAGKYNVISKGEYAYPQTSSAVLVKRYLIVQKFKRCMLLLELRKSVQEPLTALSLQIDCFDAMGNDLGVTVKEWKKMSETGDKILLKKPIGLPPSCVDVRVSVLRAEVGGFDYALGADGEFVSFDGRKQHKKLSEAQVRRETGKSGMRVSRRKFRRPVFIGFAIGAAVAATTALTLVHIFNYDKGERFVLNNVVYQCVDGAYGEGGAVEIVGSVGVGADNVYLPAEIDGHPVVGIHKDAFNSNTAIKHVTIAAGLTVPEDAFNRCGELKSVELQGQNAIEKNAFANCGKLESVTAYDLQSIGDNAFWATYSLKTLKITSPVDDEEALAIGKNVFTGSTYMREIHLGDYVAYEADSPLFPEVLKVDKLYLKNYNSSAYELATDKAICEVFDADIGELEIGETDRIADGLVRDNATLTKVTIGEIVKPVIGDYAFYKCSNLAEVYLPNKATSVGAYAFAETKISAFDFTALNSLGNDAFSGCAKLEEVNFGASTLEAISACAFEGCEGIKELNLPGKLKSIEKGAFRRNTSLRSLALPSGLQTVGDEAFAGGINLRYASIPESALSVSSDVFKDCYRLHEIENLSASVNIEPFADDGLGKYAIVVYTSATQDRIEKVESNDLVFGFAAGEWYAMEYKGAATECVFPDSVQEAGYVLTDYLFYDCKGLTKVSLTDKATRLEEYVFKGSEVGEVLFQGDSALTFSADAFSESAVAKIDFAERAFETVEAETFTDCAFLQEVSFPSALKRIGANAFAECMHLKKVVCEGIVRVEEKAFYNCIRLSQFTFGDDLLAVDNYAFDGCSLLGGTLSCEGLEEIGEFSFRGCGFEKIAGCPKLNKIGRGAFNSNIRLTEIGGCDSVRTIDEYAFYGCSKLGKVYLPATLVCIADNAFGRCDVLYEVYNSSTMSLACGSTEYGGVAYKAKVIYGADGSIIDSEDDFVAAGFVSCQPLETADDLYFMSNKWDVYFCDRYVCVD